MMFRVLASPRCMEDSNHMKNRATLSNRGVKAKQGLLPLMLMLAVSTSVSCLLRRLLLTSHNKDMISPTRPPPRLRTLDPIHHLSLPPVVLVPFPLPEPSLPAPAKLHLCTQRREERHEHDIGIVQLVHPLRERRGPRRLRRLEVSQEPVLGAVLLEERTLRVGWKRILFGAVGERGT